MTPESMTMQAIGAVADVIKEGQKQETARSKIFWSERDKELWNRKTSSSRSRGSSSLQQDQVNSNSRLPIIFVGFVLVVFLFFNRLK